MVIHGKIEEVKQNLAVSPAKKGKRIDIEDENYKGKCQKGENHRGKSSEITVQISPQILNL